MGAARGRALRGDLRSPDHGRQGQLYLSQRSVRPSYTVTMRLARVCAALELLSPPPEFAFIGSIRIGVAAGQALVGTYGGRGRRTYGVQGDRVNLAARLMIAAPEGDILCDEEIYRAAQGQVTFTALPPIRVKGFAEPVAVFRPELCRAGSGLPPQATPPGQRSLQSRLRPQSATG